MASPRWLRVSLRGAARPSSAVAANACGGFTREEFLEYVTLFNANDPQFIRFYHDDVVFELNSATVIKGPQAIREFYGPVKAHIHEKVEVAQFVSDATGIAAELPTEFRVYKDWENGFFQRPLKARSGDAHHQLRLSTKCEAGNSGASARCATNRSTTGGWSRPDHRSMTISPAGREQQTSRLPCAGGSRGSGP